jgi:hypothetical protein
MKTLTLILILLSSALATADEFGSADAPEHVQTAVMPGVGIVTAESYHAAVDSIMINVYLSCYDFRSGKKVALPRFKLTYDSVCAVTETSYFAPMDQILVGVRRFDEEHIGATRCKTKNEAIPVDARKECHDYLARKP